MVSAYEMRHTFISIIQQLPESDIKAIVGHSRSMDTFGVYAHSVDGRKASIAAGIEKVFDEIISKQKCVIQCVMMKQERPYKPALYASLQGLKLGAADGT